MSYNKDLAKWVDDYQASRTKLEELSTRLQTYSKNLEDWIIEKKKTDEEVSKRTEILENCQRAYNTHLMWFKTIEGRLLEIQKHTNIIGTTTEPAMAEPTTTDRTL